MTMCMLSSGQRLELANHILSSDAAFVSEAVSLDMEKREKVTDYERLMAGVIKKLYRLIHPASGCGNEHKDWEAQNEESYKTMKNI